MLQTKLITFKKEVVMGTQALAKVSERMPFVFDDFFKPWNEWFDTGLTNRVMSVPAVNITEHKDEYKLSLAAPGMKKDDFKIDVNGNMLTISSEKEDKHEEKEARYTRKEYSYTSFERIFTLPDEVNKEKIEAHYTDGVLKLIMPKKEEAKKYGMSKHIAVN
jgi:HSP20 family protein